MICINGKSIAWHMFFSRLSWLLFALAVSLLFGFQCRADELDPDFGGFEQDDILRDFVIDLNKYPQGADGNYIINGNVFNANAAYYDDNISLYSAGIGTASVTFKNVPGNSTFSGSFVINFGSSNSYLGTLTPGYVYLITYRTPSSKPSASVYTSNTSSDITVSAIADCMFDGYTLFYGQLQSGSDGSSIHFPALASSVDVSESRQVSVVYSITNNSTSTRDIRIDVNNGGTSSITATSTGVTLASLYSAAGVDYTSMLNDIRYSVYRDGSTTLIDFISAIGRSIGFVDYNTPGWPSSGDTLASVLKAFSSTQIDILNSVDRLNTRVGYSANTSVTNYLSMIKTIEDNILSTQSFNGITTAHQLYNIKNNIGDYESTDINSLTGRLYNLMKTTGNYAGTDYNTLNGRIYNMSEAVGSKGTISNNTIIGRIWMIYESLQTLTNGYDASAGNAAKDKLDSSLSGLDSVQDAAYNDASSTLSSFDLGAQLKFSEGLVSGLTFVRSIANSFFVSSGEFTVSVSLLFVLAFLSVLIGLWRFAHK